MWLRKVNTQHPFQFELYRLRVLDKSDLFNIDLPGIQGDEDITRVIKTAASSEFDRHTETQMSKYRWSLRDFVPLPPSSGQERAAVGFVLARSTISTIGTTVTERGIEDGTLSESTPPLATTIHVLVDLSRHLAAVEYVSAVMGSAVWRTSLHDIFDLASEFLKYRSSIRLEPVPESHAILDAFSSFTRLTRLRLVLTLPNPELTRFTAKLKGEMEYGGIKEYAQDMKNPEGLSQAQNGLPYASAAMAQDGYKIGEVLLEGVRDGRRKVIRTGRRAARATVEQIRGAVRDIFGGDIGQPRPAIISIMAEMDRIAVPPAKGKFGEPVEDQPRTRPDDTADGH
jgi:hypothetical protein